MLCYKPRALIICQNWLAGENWFSLSEMVRKKAGLRDPLARVLRGSRAGSNENNMAGVVDLICNTCMFFSEFLF